jgi:hypothetical protein
MANCVLHPGSTGVYAVYGKSYCDKCKKEMEAARKAVDKHVVPKECFITYLNANKGWVPISGTGCAHWVAHQKNLHKGSTNTKCLAGFTLKVPDAVSGKSVVPVAKVQVGDFYAEPGLHHMGLVIAVTKPKKPGDPPDIMIEHDSSGQGGLAKNTFATRFHSKGTFYR